MMKHILKGLCLAGILISCGSSNKVITDDGKVFTVENRTIKKSGEVVTDNLEAEKRNAIFNRLAEKEKAAERAQDRLDDFKRRIQEQEDIINEAEDKQRQLEKELKTFEEQLEEKKKLRQDYLDLNDKLNKKIKSFEKLKSKGELSPNDIKKWEREIKSLRQESDRVFSKWQQIK